MLKLNSMLSLHPRSGEEAPGNEAANRPLKLTDDVPKTIGVLGCKGGVGASTIAANLAIRAVSLTRRPVRVLDANLQQPDLALLMNLPVQNTLLDLVAKQGNLDEKLLEMCVTRSEQDAMPGLLAPPPSGEAVAATDLSTIAACLVELGGTDCHWFIDLPKQLDGHLVNLLDLCDSLVLVLEPTLASFAAADRWLTFLKDLGRSQSEIRLLLNRTGSKSGAVLETQTSKSFAGYELYSVPNAYQLFEECLTAGKCFSIEYPKHRISSVLTEVCKSVLGRSER